MACVLSLMCSAQVCFRQSGTTACDIILLFFVLCRSVVVIVARQRVASFFCHVQVCGRQNGTMASVISLSNLHY